MIKQKLHIELKNAPADAPQVRCSASLPLNSPAGRDSATNKVLVCNNAEVDLLQNTGGLKDACVFTQRNGVKKNHPVAFFNTNNNGQFLPTQALGFPCLE